MHVVLEGPNCAGKSTTILALSALLRSAGLDVRTTTEPTDTPFGRAIRSSAELDKRSLALAVAADRIIDYELFIEPFTSSSVVISDRYLPSSLVFQSLDGLSLDEIYALNSGVGRPDWTFYLVVDPRVLEQRLAERQMQSYFERTVSRYEECAKYVEAHDYLQARGWQQEKIECGQLSASALAATIAARAGLIGSNHVGRSA